MRKAAHHHPKFPCPLQGIHTSKRRYSLDNGSGRSRIWPTLGPIRLRALEFMPIYRSHEAASRWGNGRDASGEAAGALLIALPGPCWVNRTSGRFGGPRIGSPDRRHGHLRTQQDPIPQRPTQQSESTQCRSRHRSRPYSYGAGKWMPVR